MTRLFTLSATLTLAAAVLFRSPSDFRMEVGLVVSVAAAATAFRNLFTGAFAWTLLFVGVLGCLTPSHQTQVSPLLISILEMATLALFAASPIIRGTSTSPLVLKPLKAALITRH